MGVLTSSRRMASRCLAPLARRAARAYVAGDCVQDAARVGAAFGQRGYRIGYGYWDGPSDTPRGIADEYLASIDVLAGTPHAYISIKVPSLAYSDELMAEIVSRAAAGGVRVHFDALGPESVAPTQALVDRWLGKGAELSFTLPGRWRRSAADVPWVCERQLAVRLVKGQWVDPTDPDRDLRGGFLEVVDALAGHARHVRIASHDVTLVAESVRRLRDANTSCELELLYGLPMRGSLALAEKLDLPVCVYVPYGKAYLPYALGKLRSNPRIAWWLLRDTLRPESLGGLVK